MKTHIRTRLELILELLVYNKYYLGEMTLISSKTNAICQML